MKQKKQKKNKEVTSPIPIDWDMDSTNNGNCDFIFDKSAKITCIILWAIYLITLLTISFLPGSTIGPNVASWGTLLHYFGYVFLFLFTLITFVIIEFDSPIKKTIGFGILIAISTELIQLFIPGRFGSIGDACVNLVGLFTFPIILLIAYEQMDEEKEEFICNGLY